jgi:hypothetical protein
MKFNLVNPSIKGDMKTTFTGGSSLEVANEAYKNLSQYFNNHIPKFYFTLEDEKKKLHHFKVKEDRNGENANYTIKSYSVKSKYENDFKKQVDEYNKNGDQYSTEEQHGGRRHKKKSSSSSSSSSSDDWLDNDSSTDRYSYKVDPIINWWYYPSVYRVKRFYVPTFVQSVTPIINIPLFYWNL